MRSFNLASLCSNGKLGSKYFFSELSTARRLIPNNETKIARPATMKIRLRLGPNIVSE